MLRKAILTLVLTLTAVTALVVPAGASPEAATATRVCSAWAQVIPNVWAIVCLDREGGALFKPVGIMQNLSSGAVTMDEFLYLNGVLRGQCGTWPSTVPPGYTMTCDNNTWWTAGSPRQATGSFWVNGVNRVLYSPVLP